MVNKSHFLKNLLTTASAVAIMAGGAESALGAPANAVEMVQLVDDAILNVNNASWNGSLLWNGAVYNAGAIAANLAPTDGQGILYQDVKSLILNKANRVIEAIDINNKNLNVVAGLVVINSKTSIGSIADSSGNGNQLNMQFVNPTTLTLTGTAGGAITANNYTGLASINFNNNAGTVQINATSADPANPVVIGTNFVGSAGAAGNNGTIVVNGNNVKFDGIFDDTADQKVNNLTVTAGNTAILNTNLVLAQNVTLGDGSILNVLDTKTITATDISGDDDDHGTLNFAGASTVTGTIGATKSLAAVNLNAAGLVDVQGTVIKATNITFGNDNAILQVGANGATTITGKLVANAGGDGQIQFGGANNVTIIGNVGTAANAFGKFNFNNNDQTLTLNAVSTGIPATGSNMDFYVGNVVTNSGGGAKGTVVFGDVSEANGGGSWTIKGTFGSGGANEKLVAVNFTGSANAGKQSVIDLTNITFNADNVNLASANNAASNIYQLNNTTISDNVTTGNAGVGILKVTGNNSTIGGTIGAAAAIDAINFNAAGKLTVGGNAIKTANGIQFANANSILQVGNGNGLTTITGNLVSQGVANKGQLTVNGGDVKVIGNVGANAAALGKVNLATNNTLTLDANGGAGNFYVQNVTTATDGEGNLAFTGGNWTVKGNIGTDPANGGKALNQITIGDAGGARTVNITGGNIYGGVVFDANADHTLAINGVVNVNSNLVFNRAGQNLNTSNGATINGTIDGNGADEGTINIGAGNSTFKGAIGGNAAVGAITFTKAGTATFNANVTANAISFGGNYGRITFANDATITGTINSGGAGNGAIIVNANKNVVIASEIGGNTAIGALIVNDNATATLNANAKFDNTIADAGIILGNNSTLRVEDGANLTGTNASNNLYIQGDNDNHGTLTFNGNSTVTSLKIGQTHALQLIKLGAAGSTVTFDANTTVKATKIQFANTGTATFNANVTTANGIDFNGNAGTIGLGNNAVITGNVTGIGTLNFDGAGTVNGIINGLAAINLKGAGDVNLGNGNAVNAALITIEDAGAVARAGGLITGNVTYGAAGTLSANGGITGDVDFAGNNGTLNLAAGQTITGNVDSTVGVGGTLNFAGAGIVTNKIGNSNKLTKININGVVGTLVDLQGGTLKAVEIHFTDAGALQVASADIGNAANVGAITTLGDRVNDITIKGKNVTFTNDIGGNGNALRDIIINNNGGGDKTITIETDNFFAGIRTTTNDENNVTLNKLGGTTVYGLGAAGNALNTIRFQQDATVDGLPDAKTKFPTRGTYANAITIDNGITATFDNNLTVTGAITGANGTAVFNNVGQVANNIGANANNLAAVNFTGHGVDVHGAATPTILPTNIFANAIDFNAAQATTANATTLDGATNIRGASTITLAHDLTTSAPVTLNGSTIELGTNTLTINQAALDKSVFDNARLSTTVDKGGDIGHIEVAAGTIELTAPTTIEIHAEAGTKYQDILKGANSRSFDFINGKLTTGKVDIDDRDKQAFISWTHSNGKLIATDSSRAVTLADIAAGADPDVGKRVIESLDADPNSDAGKRNSDLSRLPQNLRIELQDREETTGATSDPVSNAVSTAITAATQAVVSNVLASTHSAVATRISNVTPVVVPSGGGSPSVMPNNNSPQTVPSGTNKEIPVSENYGIAAGEEVAATRHGLWIVPFYGQAQQKKLASDGAGYKSRSAGGTIGLDFKPGEFSTLGIAFSGVDTRFRHKDQKVGDRTNVKTFLLSLYGAREFVNNWFAQGILSFGSNHIINKETRIATDINGNDVRETAKAKYQSQSYGAEATIGRNNVIGKSILTPFAGLRVSKFREDNYKETGTDHSNLRVKKGDLNKFEGIFGMRLAVINKINEDTTVMPALHATFNYDFSSNRPNVESLLQGGKPGVSKTPRAGKLFTDLGVSLNVQHKNLEFALGYDALLAKKYFGNQGSLKVRVNF